MNQHPHFRVDFEQWCKRIESKLATGERFFVNCFGLFDAMPAFWKQMSSENRHAVVAIIDGIMTHAKTNEENIYPWRIINVLELLKYVALDDLQQLRGCDHTCTIDPSVFVEPEPHQTVPIKTMSLETVHAFRWNSNIHVDAIRRETIRGKGGSLLGPCSGASCKTADSFFTHITNFVAQRHSVITRGHQFLEPRAYLNVEITEEQRYLLQPTAADVFVGSILEDSLVQNTKKKIPPSWHINFLSGNIASYSRVLNNSEAIQHIEDVNMLSVCLSKISEIGGVIIKKIASFRHKTQKFFFFGGFIPWNFLADTPIFLISHLFHFE